MAFRNENSWFSPANRSRLSMIGIIVAASFLVYATTLANGFVYDDNFQILANPWIRDLRNLPSIFTRDVSGFTPGYTTSYYRPGMHVLYALTYHLFGLAPWGYHLVNILFHCGVSLLVFFIASRIFLRVSPDTTAASLQAGFVASLLYAVHPIHTEAVAWVGGICDLSYSFFYLSSFYFFIRSSEDSRTFNSHGTLSLITYFLATLCKEPALTLPVLVICYDCMFNKQVTVATRTRRYLAYFAVTAIYILLRYNALGGFAPAKRSLEIHGGLYLSIVPLFVQYIKKLILPVNLSLFYPPLHAMVSARALVIGGTLTVAFLAGFCIALKKSKIAAFSVILFVVPLLPAFYIPAVIDGGFAERYLYLPSAGFALLAALFLTRMKIPHVGRGTAVALVLIPLLVIYTVLTIQRNAVWHDEYTLWTDTVKKSPASPLPHGALGVTLLKMGNIGGAIREFQISLALNPQSFEGHNNLGKVYYDQGMIPQAIDEYRTALAINPSYDVAYYNLGLAYFAHGQARDAVETMETAVRLNPDNVAYREALAFIRQKSQQ